MLINEFIVSVIIDLTSVFEANAFRSLTGGLIHQKC